MVLEGSRAPGFRELEDWINSEPLSVKDTLLLDFWNYSCYSCSRRALAMQELHDAYPEIEVVGVHTPRFSFEKEPGNVRKAVERRGIDYPVALDRGSTWRDYGGYRWPTQVIVDGGEVRWKGTGVKQLRQLERAVSEVLGSDIRGLENRDFGRQERREIQLGYRFGGGFNGSGNFRGEKGFEAPEGRSLNGVYLDGRWRQGEEYLEAVEDARLFFPSRSSSVSMVAGPGGGIRDVEVLKDGEPLDEEAGEDVENGSIRVRHPDLYSVFDSELQDHELGLEAEKGTRLYSISHG